MVTVGKYGIPFHKECFRCSQCKELIDPKSEFKVKGNNLLMASCYEKFVASAN